MKLFAMIAACAMVLQAGDVTGRVIDPAGHAVAGAQVAIVNASGVITDQITDDDGRFRIYISPLYERPSLRVAASGFQTVSAPLSTSVIRLQLAPVSEAVRVVASALDLPGSEQGSSVSVITGAQLRERNEPLAVDAMRELPGLVFSQNGATGAATTLFIRGSDSKYNLVLLNGIPINSFFFGGLFDFAQIPSEIVSEIDVARGPQSAIYGSYALGGVVNFITRSPDDGANFDVLAEGGTHDENRFALSGSGKLARDFGLAGSVSSLIQNGPVANSDYRNQAALLSLTHRWRTQNLFAFGSFDSNDAGQPGAFGYGPVDLVSRTKGNTPAYALHWQDGISDKLRADVFGGFSLNNSYFVSPYGDSFNKDIRAYAELRSTYAISSYWSAAVGYAFTREELRNSFIPGLLRRDDHGTYVENRIVAGRLGLNLGAREEVFSLAGNASVNKLNPKASAAYRLSAARRLHASWGTGIRPPGGSELAFTDNPALKPERVESYDVGLDQRFFRNTVSLDATYFHNRYRDLILSLGGNLAKLSTYRTDNLANARAQGIEVAVQVRPAAWTSLSANYTWLQSEILGVTPNYLYPGQPLLRRPKHSGGLLASVHKGRVDANITGSFRSRTVDVEPNFGASAGLFRNAGYAVAGLNLNYRVLGSVTVYGRLQNALNRHYEEAFGYPSPLVDLHLGIKWALNRAR